MHATCVQVPAEARKGAGGGGFELDLLEQEFQAVVSHTMCVLTNEPRSSEPSFQPQGILFFRI
jgi:hypothetical protein